MSDKEMAEASLNWAHIVLRAKYVATLSMMVSRQFSAS